LDFSVGDLEANTIETSGTNESPQKRTSVASSKVAAKFTNFTKQSALQPSTFDNEDEEDGREQMEDDAALDNGGESFQIANDDYEEDVEQFVEEHPLPEPETQPARRGRGRPKQKGKGRATESTPEPELDIEHEPETELEDEAALATANKAARNGRGKIRKEPPVDGEDTSERTVKRARRSLEGAESAANPSEKSKLDNRSKATKIAPTTKPKINSKKSKLAPVSEAESPDIQRGPPLPRNNRGLFIMRRETPFEGNGFKQTRYGRNSVKPVAWWKNERIEYSEDEADDGTGKFLLSRIKEVVRKDEVEDARPKRTYYRPSKKGKKRPAAEAEDDDDDDEVEPWESNPGRIYGAIREWDPLDEVGAEVPEQEQEVAWSSAAIITKDVAGATFKFAKCLSIPFFGAGMMDVPVGGRKKPKNSRKMQMVFFVYTGRVQVTVNSGEPFRISKGGMWQVPRGKSSECIHVGVH
jgi:centromere protein C